MLKFVIVLATFVLVGNCTFNFPPRKATYLQEILDAEAQNKRTIETRNNHDSTVSVIFRLADINRDGFLTPIELSAITTPPDGITPLEKATENVTKGDRNRDGQLSPDEMKKLLKSFEEK